MMETSGVGTSEPAMVATTPGTVASNENLFASLFDKAALAVEELLPVAGQANAQEMTVSPALIQKNPGQEIAPQIIVPSEQIAPLEVLAAPVVRENPVAVQATTHAADATLIAQDAADPRDAEAETVLMPNPLQAELAALAMAASPVVAPRSEPVLQPESNQVSAQIATPAVSVVAPTASAAATPAVATLADRQIEGGRQPGARSLPTEPVQVPVVPVPMSNQEMVRTVSEGASPAPLPAEQKISPHGMLATHVPSVPVEALQVQEPNKVSARMPLDVAIEVGIAEQSAPATLTAESEMFSGQDSQEQQSAAPGHHLATPAVKAVETATVAAAAPTTPSLSQSVLEQVRDHLARREGNPDGNQIRMQLNPADLGELQITLQMQDKQLKVEILTENKAVKAALLENMDSLKDVLARQNIAVERFDVGTGGNSGQFFREGNRPDSQPRPLPRFMHGDGFRPGSVPVQPMAAWQPRSNALVDLRF
jgi:flagellar hook-length control protein FliK